MDDTSALNRSLFGPSEDPSAAVSLAEEEYKAEEAEKMKEENEAQRISDEEDAEVAEEEEEREEEEEEEVAIENAEPTSAFYEDVEEAAAITAEPFYEHAASSVESPSDDQEFETVEVLEEAFLDDDSEHDEDYMASRYALFTAPLFDCHMLTSNQHRGNRVGRGLQ